MVSSPVCYALQKLRNSPILHFVLGLGRWVHIGTRRFRPQNSPARVHVHSWQSAWCHLSSWKVIELIQFKGGEKLESPILGRMRAQCQYCASKNLGVRSKKVSSQCRGNHDVQLASFCSEIANKNQWSFEIFELQKKTHSTQLFFAKDFVGQIYQRSPPEYHGEHLRLGEGNRWFVGVSGGSHFYR